MCQPLRSLFRSLSLALSLLLITQGVAAQQNLQRLDRLERNLVAKIHLRGTEAEDEEALALGFVGVAMVVSGCVMMGFGLPDLEAPRPGFPPDEELARQQTATWLSGIGAVNLALGAVFVVVALTLGGEDADSTSLGVEDGAVTWRF